MRVYLEPAELLATPGQPNEVVAVLVNDGEAPSTAELRLVGLAADWVEGAEEAVVVAGGEHVRVPLVVTLPHGFPAGEHRIGVEVTVDGRATEQLAELELAVEDVRGVQVNMSPPSVRGGWRGRFQLNVRNGSDEAVTLRLSAKPGGSSAGDLQFRFKPDSVTLRPGEAARTKMWVSGKKRPIVGAPKGRALTVVAQGYSAPIHARATFEQRPILSRNLMRVTGLLVIISLWAGGLMTAVRFTEQRRSDQVAQDASSASDGAGDDGSGADGSGDGGEAGEDGETPGEEGEPGTPAGATISGKVEGLDDPSNVRVNLRPVSLVDELPTDLQLASSVKGRPGKFSAQTLQRAPISPTSSTASTVTDEEGNWAFGGLESPAYYELTFSKAGFGTRTHVVNVDGDEVAVELPVTLAPGTGRLAGTVVGPSGPLGGVGITVTDGTITLQTTTPTDGAVGTWSVDGLSTPGTYQVTAARRGFGTETAQVELGASGSNDDVRLELAEGVGSIAGVVRGAGVPLGGVLVTATNGDVTRETTTLTEDPVGAYMLPQLPIPGTYTVSIAAAGWLPQTLEVELSGNDGGVDVELVSTTAALSGTVSDGDGEPLPAVGITVFKDEEPLLKTLSAVDPEGSYELPTLLPGTYVLAFERFGYEEASKIVTLASGDRQQVDVELPLLPPSTGDGTGTIRGIVRSGTTGDIIAGANVAGGGKNAVSDASGSFVLSGLSAGTLNVTFTQAQHQTTTRTVRLGDKADVTIDVSMLPLGGLQGQVTDLTATPIAGVTVSVAAASGTAAITVPSATTDANGEFQMLQKFPTGAYVATFAKAGYGTRTREFEASAGSVSNADVTLVELGQITGIVQEPTTIGSGFAPVANATVEVVKRNDDGTTTNVFGPTTLTGQFTANNLQPGNYRVIASKGGTTVTKDIDGLKLREIRDGGVIFTPGASSVSGVVFFLDSNNNRVPINGAAISTNVVTGFQTLPVFPFITPVTEARNVTTDATGNYSVSGPVSGSVSNYTVSASGFTTRTVSVQAPTAAGSGDIALTATPRTLTGSAVLQPGATASVTATISSTSLSTPPAAQSFTAPGGTYSFANLPPGTFTVALSATGYHGVSVQQVINADPAVHGGATTVTAPQGTLDEHSTLTLNIDQNTFGGANVAAATVTLSGGGSTVVSSADSDGQVVFSGLKAATYTISVAKTGFQTLTDLTSVSANLQFPSAGDLALVAGEDQTVNVRLLRYTNVDVLVQSSEGSTALSSASVTVAPQGGGTVVTLEHVGGTATGHYTVTGLGPGDYVLTVSAPLHQTTSQALDADPGVDVAPTVTLSKYADLQITVTGESGAGIADATVTATPSSGGAAITLVRDTVTTNLYETDAVPPGTYTLRASAPGYATGTVGSVNIGVGGVVTRTIGLVRAAEIRIDVEHRPGGVATATLVGAEVILRRPDDSTFASRHRFSGDDGGGAVAFKELVAGDYEVRISKPGYVSTVLATIDLDEGEAYQQTVDLLRASIVTLTLNGDAHDLGNVDERTAVSGATVLAERVDQVGAAVPFVWTGVAGSYLAPSVEPGQYIIRASAPLHEPGATSTITVVAGTNYTPSLVLARYPTLSVTLQSDHDLSGGTALQPVTTATVQAAPSAGGGAVTAFHTSGGSYSALTITPGATTVTVTAPGHVATTMSITAAAGTNAALGTVTLVKSPRLRVQVNELPAGTTGLNGATVTATPSAGGPTVNLTQPNTTASPGLYLADPLDAGTYTLSVTKPGYTSTSHVEVLANGAETSRTTAIGSHPTVTVNVDGGLTGALAAITDASVTLVPRSGGSSIVVPHTGTGTYVSAGVPPDVYDVNATKAGHQSDTEAVTVNAGQTPGAVGLTLLRHPTVTATLTATPNPATAVASATVTLARQTDGYTLRLTEQAAGTYVGTLVSPGTYTVTATADGYGTHVSGNVVIEAGVDEPLAVPMPRLPSLSVSAVSSRTDATTALEGATVVATPTEGGVAVTLDDDGGGAYSATAVEPATYDITVTAPGHTATQVLGVAAANGVSTPGVTATLLRYPDLTVNASSNGGTLGSSTATATPRGGGGAIVLTAAGNVHTKLALPPGTYDLVVTGPGHVASSSVVTSTAGTALGAVNAVLQAYGSMVVTAYDGSVAVANAEEDVTVRLVLDADPSVTLQQAMTQPGGAATFSNLLPATTYRFELSKVGFTATSFSELIAAGENATRDVPLDRETTLVVNLLSRVGATATENLSTATIVATPDGGGDAVTLTHIGGAGSGEYRAVVEPGTYDLSLTAPGHVATTDLDVAIPEGDTVERDLTMLALPKVRVQLRSIVQLGGDTASTLENASLVRGVLTPGGTATIDLAHTGDGVYEGDVVTPGTYDIRVEAPGHTATDIVGVDLDAGGGTVTESRDLVALRGTVEGTVRDAFNQPVVGVDVTASAPGATATTSFTTQTDGVGEYSFTDLLAPGTWTITFVEPDYSVLSIAVTVPKGSSVGQGADVIADAFIVPDGAAIIGTLLASASSVAGSPTFEPGVTATVTLDPQFGSDPNKVFTIAATDSAYAFVGLQAGSYQLTFAATGHTSPGPVTVAVDEGEIHVENHVVIQSPGTLTVTARTFATGNAALTNTDVTFRITGPQIASGSATAITDDVTGIADFGSVPPGQYRLTVDSITGANISETVAGEQIVTVQAGVATAATETFTPYGSVSGLVNTDDGSTVQPASGATVTLTGLDASGATATMTTTTSSSGAYSFSNVPISQTTYTITADAFGETDSDTVDVDRGDADVVPTLVVAPVALSSLTISTPGVVATEVNVAVTGGGLNLNGTTTGATITFSNLDVDPEAVITVTVDKLTNTSFSGGADDDPDDNGIVEVLIPRGSSRTVSVGITP